MDFQYNDGGRKEAGYRGKTGDCVVRAIAIATELPYQKVYDDLFSLNRLQHGKLRGASPRNGGTKKRTIRKYLERLGWKWTPTMLIGQGCKTHLRETELPMGRLIVAVSKHLTAVIDHIINDTYNPDRGGWRCVYGYYKRG